VGADDLHAFGDLPDAKRLFPATADALAQRNEVLRGLTTMPADEDRPAYTALVLPDFVTAEQAASR